MLYNGRTQRNWKEFYRLKILVLAKEDETIENIMTDDYISVNTHDDQEYIAEIFKKI